MGIVSEDIVVEVFIVLSEIYLRYEKAGARTFGVDRIDLAIK